MLTANVFFFFNNICCGSFSDLEYFYKFLNPSIGFSLTKSKNLTFSSRERNFFASLASVCDAYYGLAELVESVSGVIINN